MKKSNGELRKGIFAAIFAVFACTSLAACNSFEENAYKSVKSAATAYDSAMNMAADYYADIPEANEKAEFWAKVEAVAKPVRAALISAKTACMTYSVALDAYNRAKAAAGEAEEPGEEQACLDKLQTELAAAKAAAKAALSAVDTDAMSDAIKTLIDLF